MSNGNLDTRFVWFKPEAKPGSKGKGGFERKWGFDWHTKKGDLQLHWTSEKERGGYTIRYQPPFRLFRIFAGLRDRVGFIAFANAYGDILGVPGLEYYQLDGAAISGRRIVRPYATLRMWQFQIERMHHAVEQWDIWKDERASGRAKLQARKQLQIEIESALRDVATPSCARACLNQNMELFLYPVNLLAFMWLSLARIASGEIAEQKCLGQSEGCTEYIYTGVGPGLKKTGTTTCSDACRKRKERDTGLRNTRKTTH